ncbi:ester cyclase [Candidatus Leptofilum sp.]|uniref:ester cyclase n=1 Tax=Candidatus Leptofilum sp. TaxID=3241576 RepID=UPI003B5B73EF
MSTKENLNLIQRMYEALNAQDLDAHHKYWTEDMIWRGPPGFGDIHGVDGFKNEVLKPFYATFPDYYVRDEIQIASGNWLAATGILTGTPQDDWLGVPPTGKPIVMRYSDFWRVENGKLAENWVMVDNLGVMLQLADSEAEPQAVDFKKIYMTEADPAPAQAQQNIDLVHSIIDVLNAHDLNGQDNYWTEGMIWHGPPGFGDILGLAAFRDTAVHPIYTAFPDLGSHDEKHGIQIELADDQWVAATGIVTGTHLGRWFNIPATGKQVAIRYSGFWRIENGKLAENWAMIDHVDLLRQLGVEPLTIKF